MHMTQWNYKMTSEHHEQHRKHDNLQEIEEPSGIRSKGLSEQELNRDLLALAQRVSAQQEASLSDSDFSVNLSPVKPAASAGLYHKASKQGIMAEASNVPKRKINGKKDDTSPTKRKRTKSSIRYDAGPSTEICNFKEPSLTVEDLQKDDTELYLISTPQSMGLPEIDGQSVGPGPNGFIKSKDNKQESIWSGIDVQTSRKTQVDLCVLLPDKNGQLQAVKSLAGQISLHKTMVLPEYKLPQVKYRGPPALGNDRKMRHVPFGADLVSSPKKKKEKKKKKKKKD